MDRRTLLRAGGLGFLGLGLGACGTRAGLATPPRFGRRLVPVAASWDRVIRTTVGLRPYRPSGFVVAAERLTEDLLLIHNYGHGGSGMSLSWGTASLAADFADGHEDRRAAVLGCGVAGLTTARELQRRGFSVTIYAATVPPDTTSNMSLAGWTPTSGLVDGDHRTAAWDAQLRRAAEIAYRQLQLLVGAGYGVSWIDSFSLRETAPPPRDSAPPQDSLLPPRLRTGATLLGPGEHPFHTTYVTRRATMRIEPSIYLDALVRDVLRFGGRIVIRRFDSQRELTTLDETLVVNCTGLGSRTLFGDVELTPVKGQLTLLVPQPEVDYGTFGGATQETPPGMFGIHMQPRSDGIALGGTSEEGVWSIEPNEEARVRVVEEHIRLFAAMRA